jgi:hypothetical protein
MKLDPLSDCKASLGNPTQLKYLIKAFITDLAVIFRSGIASGNLVEAHIMVNKY